MASTDVVAPTDDPTQGDSPMKWTLLVFAAVGLIAAACSGGAPEAGGETSSSTSSLGSAPASDTLATTVGAGGAPEEPAAAAADGETLAPGPLYIGNTGEQGVAVRRACETTARTGAAWPDGTLVQVIGTDDARCAGWSHVAGPTVSSWVRDEYLTSTPAARVSGSPPQGGPGHIGTGAGTPPPPAGVAFAVSGNALSAVLSGDDTFYVLDVANSSGGPLTVTWLAHPSCGEFEDRGIVGGRYQFRWHHPGGLCSDGGTRPNLLGEYGSVVATVADRWTKLTCFYNGAQTGTGSPCTATNVPAPPVSNPPTVAGNSMRAILSGDDTFYIVDVDDPDGDQLSVTWPGHPSCGESTDLGGVNGSHKMQWAHPGHLCPDSQPGGILLGEYGSAVAHISDGAWVVTCTFTGANTGTGSSCQTKRITR